MTSKYASHLGKKMPMLAIFAHFLLFVNLLQASKLYQVYFLVEEFPSFNLLGHM